ncbi:MAG: hypothetical protein JWM11_2530 [Planctomycetaceae bacterium]|nr:hypothetical protein [Planctomycetaceae bacterium]
MTNRIYSSSGGDTGSKPDERELEEYARNLESAQLFAGQQASVIAGLMRRDMNFHKKLIAKFGDQLELQNFRLPVLTPEEQYRLAVLAAYGAARYDASIMKGVLQNFEKNDPNAIKDNIADLCGR